MNMNHTSSVKECLIYPGIYTEEKKLNTLFLKNKEKGNNIYYNATAILTEKDDTYKLQIKIPAVEKENIVIEIEESVLFIYALETTIKIDKLKLENKSKLKNKIVNCYYILPENGNIEFLHVAFKIGILTLYIPKNNNSFNKEKKEIIAY